MPPNVQLTRHSARLRGDEYAEVFAPAGSLGGLPLADVENDVEQRIRIVSPRIIARLQLADGAVDARFEQCVAHHQQTRCRTKQRFGIH